MIVIKHLLYAAVTPPAVDEKQAGDGSLNVSLKNRNDTRQRPENAAMNQKVARQLNASVKTPPIIGPRAGPSSGALRNIGG